MANTHTSPAPDTQIRRDRMRLAVTNLYPVSRRQSEQEARQEIFAVLCRIFQNYA